MTLTGINAAILIDQSATWACSLAACCHDGELPMDLVGSFMVLEAVISASGVTMEPLARAAVETAMSSCCLLHREAFAGHSVVVRDALVRADLLGPSLVAPEALRESLEAFPDPPVCSGLPHHGLKGGK